MRKNWYYKRIGFVLLGVLGLCLVFGLSASVLAGSGPGSKPKKALADLGLEVGETRIFETDFTLLVDGVEMDFSEVEVTIKPATFTVSQPAELLENRTYFEDEYWCSYPNDKDYWFCGPMDGSQYHCQYFEGADPICFNDFNQ